MAGPSVLNVYAFAEVTSGTITATTAGSLLVAAVAGGGGTSTVTAPVVGGTSMNQDVAPFGSTTAADCLGVYSIKPATGTTSISMPNGATDYQAVMVWELSPGSGTWGSSPFDVVGKAGPTTSTSPSSGASPSTAQAVEMILGIAAANAFRTWSGGTGYTFDHPTSGTDFIAGEHLVTSSAGAQTATFTVGSAEWVCAVVAYQTTSGDPYPLIYGAQQNIQNAVYRM